MTFDELKKAIEGLSPETFNESNFLDALGLQVKGATPPVEPTPPVPPKADDPVTMTAAEMLKLFTQMAGSNKEDKKEDKEDEQIYI